MSITTSQVASATSGPLENTMPNVIDALKRLERIGSEHSETTRKIIEAAKELSEKIASLYPESTTPWTTIAYESQEWEDFAADSGRPPKVFGRDMDYVLQPDNRVPGHPLRVFNRKLNLIVDGSRDVALGFAADIAHGLLEHIEKDLQKRLAADQNALEVLRSGGTNNPRLSLTKRPIAWSRVGSEMFTGPVIQYEVDGMPTGERVLVALLNGRWKVMRINGENQSDWRGDYANADDAVNAILSEESHVKLTLEPIAFVTTNGDRRDAGWQYKVCGLPASHAALIQNLDAPRVLWSILRIKDGKMGDPTGSYPSAEAALAALQEEFD
jgi:hypothetical protein